MSDTAKGPLAGYLFQFEKALLMLASLEKSADFISIENIDDIAVHGENGTILISIQAKHSISNSGSTFQDTSYALWRTLQIWVTKLNEGLFNKNTVFICTTNKIIPNTSFLWKIKNNNFDFVKSELKILVNIQKNKLKEIQEKDPKKGGSIIETLRLVNFVKNNEKAFEIITNNLVIEDNENVKEKLINKLHLNSKHITETQRNNIFHSLFGWIIDNSKAKWNNGNEANFTKQSFDDKWYLINNNPSIINAIFRTKDALGAISNEEIAKRSKELFVRQIEDINRRKVAKERIIKDAILDFIYRDIELAYIIKDGNFTQTDFLEFLETCYVSWMEIFDTKVLNEVDEYTEDENNKIAIEIFDHIMNFIDIKFKDGYSFNSSNKYIKNGSFLILSNIPRIGWRPDWEIKYSK